VRQLLLILSFANGLAAGCGWPTAARSAPAPKPGPFSDYRTQVPGKSHLIRAGDLPPPNFAESADNGPRLVPRPADAWPKAPAGFVVQLYADGLAEPRLVRTAPNGDLFVAESRGGAIRVLRGLGPNGRAVQIATFARGLKKPFGLAFYPPAGEPRWLYVGDTDAVVRFPYASGDLVARGPRETIVPDLPAGGLLRGGGHWTRDVAFSLDGKRMFVSVGSQSNVDDSDGNAAEFHRADILAYTPDGKEGRVFAWGIRNAVGIAVQPRTGVLWASVNERDRLGDNLVPDYITSVREGGFYGWPWYYIGANQDPRHAGKHPELAARVIVPDVLLQPHDASLEMLFYEGAQFPAGYRGDIFAAEHGSWNRSVRCGYEVVRVPMHGKDRATGEYEDFLTGFVTDRGEVWGRPVGVAVAADGALLVSDDGTSSIWRVSYVGGK
jgi:glucose/arabinose dehydrogenase